MYYRKWGLFQSAFGKQEWCIITQYIILPSISSYAWLTENYNIFGILAVEGITDVYTIEKVKQTITKFAADANSPADHISGTVFAYLTRFNIDENVDNVLATRW